MGSRSRDRGGGVLGPGGRTFVTPLRYTNCSFLDEGLNICFDVIWFPSAEMLSSAKEQRCTEWLVACIRSSSG